MVVTVRTIRAFLIVRTASTVPRMENAIPLSEDSYIRRDDRTAFTDVLIFGAALYTVRSILQRQVH